MERNEKLAKWAGFVYFDHPPVFGPNLNNIKTGWYYPGEEPCYHLPDFKNSVDLCFKWLVPELNKRGYYYELFQWNNNEHKAVIIKPTKYWADIIASEITDTPASALAEAIGKVIDNE